MRLALILALAASPVAAGTLPSGLADPFTSAETCQAFVAEIGAGGDAALQAIAFTEARLAHSVHSGDAKTADDLLYARSLGTVALPDEAVAVYVERVCRGL